MTAPERWRDVQERGSTAGMLFTVMVYRFFGRAMTEVVLMFAVAYFFLTDGRVRKASGQYLARVHGQPLRKPWAEVFAHYWSFTQTSIDRFDIWSGRVKDYTFHYHGTEHLGRLHEENQGAVIIGAHLGNFDTLSAMAKRHNTKIHILMDRRNAQKFSSILKRFDSGMEEGVLDYDMNSVESIFELQKAVKRGEYVALLGDRVAAESPRGSKRVSVADFLGAPAPLPQAPFLFAAHMNCPVLLMFGFKRAARCYDLFIEPFADSVVLPEESHARALTQYVRAYAARLEHYCRLYPLQWFNFYDFWRQPA